MAGRFGFRGSLRTALIAALGVLALPACNDQKGDPAGPSAGILTGNGLFQTAVVSAGVFRMQNHFAEKALELLDSGTTVPLTEPSCLGSGTAVVAVSETDPNTFLVQFTNFVMECSTTTLPLTFNSINGTGRMVITFLEHSPGLVYEISEPYDFTANAPIGASCQLPSEAGSTILLMSTPEGPLHFALDGPRGTPSHVSMDGSLRFEDRSAPLVVVEELSLTFAFDEGLSPKFADWPGGNYQIAGFQGGGGFFGAGATPSFPVECFFDGFGGAAYPVEGHQCTVNLGDLVHGNPCADQNNGGGRVGG